MWSLTNDPKVWQKYQMCSAVSVKCVVWQKVSPQQRISVSGLAGVRAKARDEITTKTKNTDLRKTRKGKVLHRYLPQCSGLSGAANARPKPKSGQKWNYISLFSIRWLWFPESIYSSTTTSILQNNRHHQPYLLVHHSPPRPFPLPEKPVKVALHCCPGCFAMFGFLPRFEPS